ncbi:hypothetical protein [Streptomyces sp. NPDC060194]|uniref:hypothetical protein n=1 Tax=Streptomyces sp. NPDC060194 TaxID=3347069 RepID=UPI0036529D2D
MSVLRHHDFGTVSREDDVSRARVEVPGRPAVTMARASQSAPAQAVAQERGRDSSRVGVHLSGAEGGDEPVYGGAAVFGGSVRHTRFPIVPRGTQGVPSAEGQATG